MLCEIMKNKLTTRTTRLIYSISAILIAVLTASTFTLTGFASPIAQTGSAGFGGSNLQEIVKEQISIKVGNSSIISPVLLFRSDINSETIVKPVVENAPVAADPISPTFISLTDFSSQLANGNGNQITGLYSENNFALAVVQQPSGQAGFVSTTDDTTTQFKMAAGLGFLAHNYLAGSNFFSLSGGGIITVVYGDGNTRNYRVSSIRKFQALDPDSAYSNFIDLASGEQLSVSDLFYQTYGVSGQMVLQTCISANGNSSWGRLFIIATPEN
jgi:hypothetical protein